jgi:hypothetical protein
MPQVHLAMWRVGFGGLIIHVCAVFLLFSFLLSLSLSLRLVAIGFAASVRCSMPTTLLPISAIPRKLKWTTGIELLSTMSERWLATGRCTRRRPIFACTHALCGAINENIPPCGMPSTLEQLIVPTGLALAAPMPTVVPPLFLMRAIKPHIFLLVTLHVELLGVLKACLALPKLTSRGQSNGVVPFAQPWGAKDFLGVTRAHFTIGSFRDHYCYSFIDILK